MTQQHILQLSYQYQREWRFQKELELIQSALIKYPNWDYLHKRLEWHSRPIFHRDPEKSKTQPRKPLYLPRDPQYIPKQETLNSLCFVTGTSSNAPYFELAVQLIESLKATRCYNQIPIKIFDCGLTKEDANYLSQHFNAEVKDPGWDVDPHLLINNHINIPQAGYKGIISRPYAHKHFPGYTYYCFMDCDMWIQDERCLDQYLHLCEQQEVALSKGPQFLPLWPPHSDFKNIIPDNERHIMIGKKTTCGGLFCIHKNFMELYHQEFKQLVQRTKFFSYSSDDIILNYVFHKYKKQIIFENPTLHSVDLMSHPYLAIIDGNKNLKINNQYIGAVCLGGNIKHYPHHILFGNKNSVTLSLKANNEKTLHYISKKHPTLSHGSFFYRLYPQPEDLYGNIDHHIL